MSRIGKEPIILPSGVKVEIDGTHVKVSGAKGALERDCRPEIEIEQKEGQIFFKPKGNSKRIRSFWGMTRTLIQNMVQGVEQGFDGRIIPGK